MPRRFEVFALFAVSIALIGVASCESSEVDSTPDAGSDASIDGTSTTFESGTDSGTDTPIDVPTHEPAEFERFDYSWYGTGVSERYRVDRDCGISGKPYGSEAASTTTGAGVIATDDCSGFAARATSSETMSILVGATPCKYMASDDYGTWTLDVAGAKYTKNLAGCTDYEPFVGMKKELRRLFTLYAKPLSDAGTD